MTTMQPLDQYLQNTLISLIKTPESFYKTHVELCTTDTHMEGVVLPVLLDASNVSITVAVDTPGVSLPVSVTSPVTSSVVVEPEIGPEDKNVSIPASLLSPSAEVFLPSVMAPLPDNRPYPPGLTEVGVEWSISDSAWMALEYGKVDMFAFQPESAAVPDLKETKNLKTLEVRLPNAGVFDDKTLPAPDTELVPHPDFPKEYFIELHHKVRKHGTYNYAGARVELKHSKFNIELFRKGLTDYDDLGIISYMEYGFPLGLSQEVYLEPLTTNHSSAYQYFKYVDAFIAKGISLAECTGPWPAAPIDPIMTSPMMTADKSPGSRRTVFDASFGNFSLNQNTPEKEYLGEEYQFKFPSVLDLADMIVKLGRGCLLYKRDLSRWFLQLPVDPGDYDKLAFVWRGCFWLFCSYIWGCRHAGYNGQRVACAILFILVNIGKKLTGTKFNALVYMDDFAGCEKGATAQLAFDSLGKLLTDLGVRESSSKASSPSTTMTFLGVEFDTDKMCMRINETKRSEIQKLSIFWSKKTVATKQELQSILGKLIWISKVVRFSRCFVSRIISLIKTLKHQKQKTTLSAAVKKDFVWWSKFLGVFNGIELLVPTTVSTSVLGDAYPMGSGSWNEQAKEYYSRKFPWVLCDTKYPIHLKEFWCVIVATRLWGHLWSGKRVAIYCDNVAVVEDNHSP